MQRFLFITVIAILCQVIPIFGQSQDARDYAYSQYLRIMGGETDINAIKSIAMKFEITNPGTSSNYLLFLWKSPYMFKLIMRDYRQKELWEYNFDGLHYWKTMENQSEVNDMNEEDKQTFYTWIAYISNIRWLELSGAEILPYTRQGENTSIVNVKLPANVIAHYQIDRDEAKAQILKTINVEGKQRRTLIIQTTQDRVISDKPVKFPVLMEMRENEKLIHNVKNLAININQGVPTLLFIKPGSETEWDIWKEKQDKAAVTR